MTRSCADRNERQRRSTSSESDPSSERIGKTVDRVSGIGSISLLLEGILNGSAVSSALECERHFRGSSGQVDDRRLRSGRRKRTHLLDLYLSLFWPSPPVRVRARGRFAILALVAAPLADEDDEAGRAGSRRSGELVRGRFGIPWPFLVPPAQRDRGSVPKEPASLHRSLLSPSRSPSHEASLHIRTLHFALSTQLFFSAHLAHGRSSLRARSVAVLATKNATQIRGCAPSIPRIAGSSLTVAGKRSLVCRSNQQRHVAHPKLRRCGTQIRGQADVRSMLPSTSILLFLSLSLSLSFFLLRPSA